MDLVGSDQFRLQFSLASCVSFDCMHLSTADCCSFIGILLIGVDSLEGTLDLFDLWAQVVQLCNE